MLKQQRKNTSTKMAMHMQVHTRMNAYELYNFNVFVYFSFTVL